MIDDAFAILHWVGAVAVSILIICGIFVIVSGIFAVAQYIISAILNLLDYFSETRENEDE